jgi:hypothetical protein
MRKERELAENVWYIINTSVNDGELLFQTEFGVWLLEWVLSEAKERYAFELRGVRLAGATVSFFIKPADGLQLPDIMKCIKQTFAVRFDRDHGRTGRGAQGRTRNVERVVVPRRHGGPLIPASQTTRLTGPTGIGRGYSMVSRRLMRSCTCSTLRFVARTAGRGGRKKGLWSGRAAW